MAKTETKDAHTAICKASLSGADEMVEMVETKGGTKTTV